MFGRFIENVFISILFGRVGWCSAAQCGQIVEIVHFSVLLLLVQLPNKFLRPKITLSNTFTKW